MTFGTLSTLDTLAAGTTVSLAQFGEDRAFEQIQATLDAHNAQLRDAMGTLVEMTTDRLRRYGGTDSMDMAELDQFGTPDAQKVSAGATVGFPLRLYGRSVQWTRKYFQNVTAAEFAAQFLALTDADVKLVQRELKRAFFTATNNTTYKDVLLDNVTLALRRLVNADSEPIPLGPNGESFTASSHTHYLYTASTSLAAADVTALILAVAEHYAMGVVRVYINAAQEAAMRALTGFTAITPTFVTPATSAAAIVQNYDTRNLGNRLIGYFGSNYAEAWVKPWIPAGYLFAYVDGAPAPLVMRERRAGSGGMQIVADDEQYPLRARTVEREFGMGVWNRTNGAVLMIDSGSAGAYVSPSIS